MNITKTSLNINNKSLLRIEKNNIEWEKMLYYNNKKFLKNNDLECSFDKEYKDFLRL